MKNLLFVAGIVLILVGVIALIFSVLQGYGYHHLLDGETERYIRLRRRMIIFFIIGIALAVLGMVCLMARVKI